MVYPGPPPPPQKNNTTKIVLIVVGVVAALCCCGAVVGGFWLFKSAATAVGPARSAADAFLDHLESGETDVAYTYLCSQARDEFTAEQFDEIVAGRPTMAGHEILGTIVNNNNGRVSASVNAGLTYADGSSETHSLKLIKEDGNWRVCGNPY